MNQFSKTFCRIRVLATLALFSSVQIVCGQTPGSDTTGIGIKTSWKLLDEKNFSLRYPPEWELNQSGMMGTTFILFSPLRSDKDQFKENVNLLIQDLSGHKIDLNQYVAISEDQVKTMISRSTLIESKRMKNGTEEYHRMIFTGDQGMYHLKFEQHYWIKDENAFVLTLTCEQANFDDYKMVGEAILNSFTLKK